jgi:hypothetical protein
VGAVPTSASGKAKSFYGSVEVNPATAKIRLVQLVEEVINNLASDPQGELKITVEINADFLGIPLTQVAPISSMPGWWQKSIRGM